MKKLYTILLPVVLLLISQKSFSQDTSIIRYLPLQVGNQWVYIERSGYPCTPCVIQTKYSITGTGQINGKTYFKISISSIYNDTFWVSHCPHTVTRLYGTKLIRIDSLTGNVYTSENCGSGYPFPLDSLNAKKGDSVSVCFDNPGIKYYCSDTGYINLFVSQWKSKSFTIAHAAGGEVGTYVMGIGYYGYSWAESAWWWEELLQGCVINGVVYGDTTTLVGVNPVSGEVPATFSLSQNYPNPFNPSTKIKFNIAPPLRTNGAPLPLSGGDVPAVAGSVGVKLTIYDALGRDVATLVNEQLKPGTYEADWDGTNFPSGVYFYKLMAGDFVTTKKMVLIK